MSFVLVTQLIVAVFAVVCVMVARGFIKRHGLHRVLFRLGTGHHLDGTDRTNRGHLARGTRHVSGVHHRSTWLDRTPRAWRAAAFWAVVFGVPYYLIGMSAAPAATVLALRCAIAAIAAVLGLAGLRQLLRRHHRKHVIRPASIAMASHLQLSAPAIMRQLKIRPRAQNAEPGQVVARIRRFPDHYVASQSDKDWVEQFLSSRIPCSLRFDWKMHKHPMSLDAICASAPPRQAVLADWAGEIDALGPDEYLPGIAAGSKKEIWIAGPDPHSLACARPRRGKTNLLLNIIATDLRRGRGVTCVDLKEVSEECFTGVPGFTYAHDAENVAEMWAVIEAFWGRMKAARRDRRYDQGETLVIEEVTQTFAVWRDHWDKIKPPGARIGDSPVWGR